jgi:aspartate ammonia-lyase
MRIEKDFLGEVTLPDNALYGINAWRASQNFKNNSSFSYEWYKATGAVKQACYQTAISFIDAARRQFPEKTLPAGCNDLKILEVLEETAGELAAGKYFEQFIVPAVQGGAGTAINMNINEIIANVSLQKMGQKPGEYHIIDPFIHANIFQSTNDVIPTALRIALMRSLNQLEICINELRSAFEKHESNSRDALRIAYTQLQQAVPSSFGLLFSAWSDAFSRDWWRISKCFERIKVTNLGGGATGTGMAIPRYFAMEVTNRLRELVNLPVTRSENHTDTTQNLDVFVEVHAILKAHAVNLEKIASDMRLLGSDLMGQHELRLPQKQTGSSIMPGKVNPVINEFVISCTQKVYANDMMISSLCAMGQLDLNAYIPSIGHAMLESFHLLVSADESMLNHLVNDLQVESQTAIDKLMHSPSITTALLPLIGYEKASELARSMKNENLSIIEANNILNLIDSEKLEKALQPDNLLKLGYSLNDVG